MSFIDLMIPSKPLYCPDKTFFFWPIKWVLSLRLLPIGLSLVEVLLYLRNFVYLRTFVFSEDWSKKQWSLSTETIELVWLSLTKIVWSWTAKTWAILSLYGPSISLTVDLGVMSWPCLFNNCHFLLILSPKLPLGITCLWL